MNLSAKVGTQNTLFGAGVKEVGFGAVRTVTWVIMLEELERWPLLIVVKVGVVSRVGRPLLLYMIRQVGCGLAEGGK